jgi:HD-like signal output (HDOD) protein
MAVQRINHAEVKTCLNKRQNLPTLPHTFASIVAAISDPNSSLLDLAELIACDPTLTANVLRIANSSFMALREPVEDLPTAILNLGVFEIRRAALSVGAFEVFKLKAGSARSLENIWLHSLATGFISQQIATIGKFEFVDDAYLAGLLHDIGKIFFATFYADNYAELREEIIQGKGEGIILETKTFGMTHTYAAAGMCEHWKLPGKTSAAAIHHHDPSKLEGDERTICLCVSIANVLAHLTVRDEPGEPSIPKAREWLKELAEISREADLLNFDDLVPIALLEAERARYFEEIVGE